jgi:zinc protease
VFPEAALAELKQQAITDVERQRKEPGRMAHNAVDRWGNPYPRGDVRYVSTFDETVEDVKAVTVDKLRDFHSRFYGARQGELRPSAIWIRRLCRSALQAAFGDWDRGAPYVRVPQPLERSSPSGMLLETPDKQNATLLVRSNLAVSDRDPDYPALMMANYLLGGGGNSRLWKRIREGEGLSLRRACRHRWSSFEANSPWQASAIYAPPVRAKVERRSGRDRPRVERRLHGAGAERRPSRAAQLPSAVARSGQLRVGGAGQQPLPRPDVRLLGTDRCGTGFVEARTGQRGAAQVREAGRFRARFRG